MKGAYASHGADYGVGFDGDDYTSEQESREWAPPIQMAEYAPDWGVGIEEYEAKEFGIDQGFGARGMGDSWDDLVGMVETGVTDIAQGVIQQGVDAISPGDVSYIPPISTQIMSYDQYNRPIYPGTQPPPQDFMKQWGPVMFGAMGVGAFLITLSMFVGKKS